MTTPPANASVLCPAKIMLAGEYAVVDGGPAVLIAVDRHAIARISPKKQSLSPFLQEVHILIAKRFGPSSPQALAASKIVVDTSAFLHNTTKLGLGSSAAATVSAVAMAMSVDGPIDPKQIYPIAKAAHGDAQQKQGARGSGADIACCTFGGTISFDPGHHAGPLPVLLPSALHWVFPWMGKATATAPMVTAVQLYKSRDPDHYAVLRQDISEAAMALIQAENTDAAIGAIGRAGLAVRALGAAAKVPIWLDTHTEIANLAAKLGGAAKPSGAGGGDLAIAVFPSAETAKQFHTSCIKKGIICPPLSVDSQGVRLSP